jgi:folate-binding Fe-S cluster repair protein YgfZ
MPKYAVMFRFIFKINALHQGRVMYDVFLYTQQTSTGLPGYLLEYDCRSSEALPILPMLKQYVLRKKVKIRDVSDQYDVWTAWGSEAVPELPKTWNWARSGCVEPAWGGDPWPWGTEHESLVDRRADTLGRRLLIRKGDKREGVGPVSRSLAKILSASEAISHDIGTESDYLLHRITLGVPEGIDDIVPMHAFPMESNLDMMGGCKWTDCVLCLSSLMIS